MIGNVIVTQEEKQHSRRNLKGLLALLPETGALYRYKHPTNQLDLNNCECVSSKKINAFSTKITSRKQQRRQLNRYRKELQAVVEVASGSDDVESSSCRGERDMLTSNEIRRSITYSTTIHLSDLIRDNDVAILFLFDPYQAYSIQLLYKLFEVCKVANEVNVKAIETHERDGYSSDGSKLHCFLVTSCKDKDLIDGLLENSGTVLLPWTTDNGTTSLWKIAMGGANVCPSILAIVECTKGRNLFPINQEELALDWNTSVHVYNSWFSDHVSAYTLMQRIKAYALYPTSSNCTIQ
jgi:hypothetical protein